jgi:hypothetical protein
MAGLPTEVELELSFLFFQWKKLQAVSEHKSPKKTFFKRDVLKLFGCSQLFSTGKE